MQSIRVVVRTVVFLAAIGLASVPALLSQTPARSGGPGNPAANLPLEGTAAISGVVTDATTKRPGQRRLESSDADQSEWQAPEFLAQALAGGVKVTLGDGEKKTQDLRIR